MNIAVTFLPRQEPTPLPPIAFIGGGNMASAIIGGLIRQDTAGRPPSKWSSPSPRPASGWPATSASSAQAEAGAALARCEVVVWAVKPQSFAEAARPVRALGARRPAPERRRRHSVRQHRALARHRARGARHAQHAGAGRPGHDRAVRARSGRRGGPEARRAGAGAPRANCSGSTPRSALDAVTAISGSGPAYVFYFIEAMTEAGIELGLTPEQAHQLAVGTFTGASALAAQRQRTAGGAARARDLQGRHHLRGDHVDGECRRQGEVQGRHPRRAPARRANWATEFGKA